MLAALVPPELNAQIVIYDEISDKKLPTESFDIVAITAIASESVRAYELADYYRGLGACVILGGYHVTFMPNEALEHADAIVTGEGLSAWPKLLQDFASGKPISGVYHDEVSSPKYRPIPKREILKSQAYAPISTIIASNGCPNNCSFCAIRKMAQHSCRPIEDVIAELRSLKHHVVIFYDPNFFANRLYALELMEAMKPLRLRWGATATIDFGFDDELMKAAEKSGCSGVLIGFESFNATALGGANKNFRDPSFYKKAIENIHRHHMTINGTFVLGLDEDDEHNLAALPDNVRKLGIDLPIYFILTPTPGNDLYYEMKAQNRLLTEDWSRYSQADVVFKPKKMTPEQLFMHYRAAWRKTYSFWNILQRVFGAPGTSFFQKFIVLCMNMGFKFLGRDRS